VVVAVILGVGRAVSSGPVLELDGRGLLVCAGINLGACWLAFVPSAIVSHSRRYRSYLPQAILGGTTIRLLVVAPATMALIEWSTWPMMPLTIWMVVFYLSLLAVETVLAVRLLNRESKTMDGCAAV
jgi:hypothetical protein